MRAAMSPPPVRKFAALLISGDADKIPRRLKQPSVMPRSGKKFHPTSRAQFKADPRIPALTLGMDVLRQLHIYVVYNQKSIYMTAAN